MPLIRQDLSGFVKMWNIHRIRKQSNAAHVVSGQPFSLYFGLDDSQPISSFAEEIPADRWQLLMSMFESDLTMIDDYLPATTFQICSDFIGELPLQPKNVNYPFLSSYLQLRDFLKSYSNSQKQPEISLIQSQTEGVKRIQDFLSQQEVNNSR
jgi:hypothetical protein